MSTAQERPRMTGSAVGSGGTFETVDVSARPRFQDAVKISWDPRLGEYRLVPTPDAETAVYRVVVEPNAFYVGEARDLSDRPRRHLREGPVEGASDQARLAAADSSRLGEVQLVSMTATAEELVQTTNPDSLDLVKRTRSIAPDAVYMRLAVEGLALAVSVGMWPKGRCLNRLHRDGEGMRYAE